MCSNIPKTPKCEQCKTWFSPVHNPAQEGCPYEVTNPPPILSVSPMELEPQAEPMRASCASMLKAP